MNQKRAIAGLCIIALLVVAALVVGSKKFEPTLEARTDSHAQTLVRLGNQTFEVELAVTVEQKAKGLSGRDRLDDTAGMVFIFKPAEIPSFWMKDMKFNLDIVWIYQGKIIAISRDVPAPAANTRPENLPTYSPEALTDYVLEINAGAAKNLKIGDSFEIIDSFAV